MTPLLRLAGLALALLLAGCGSQRFDLMTSGQVSVVGAGGVQDPDAVQAGLTEVLSAELFLAPENLEALRAAAAEALDLPVERIAIGLDPVGFPLPLPADLWIGLGYAFDAAAARIGPGPGEGTTAVTCGFTCVGAIQGDASDTVDLRTLEPLAGKLALRYVATTLAEELQWELTPSTQRRVAAPLTEPVLPGE